MLDQIPFEQKTFLCYDQHYVLFNTRICICSWMSRQQQATAATFATPTAPATAVSQTFCGRPASALNTLWPHSKCLKHLVAATQVPRTPCGRTASTLNTLWLHRKCLEHLVATPQVLQTPFGHTASAATRCSRHLRCGHKMFEALALQPQDV